MMGIGALPSEGGTRGGNASANRREQGLREGNREREQGNEWHRTLRAGHGHGFLPSSPRFCADFVSLIVFSASSRFFSHQERISSQPTLRVCGDGALHQLRGLLPRHFHLHFPLRLHLHSGIPIPQPSTPFWGEISSALCELDLLISSYWHCSIVARHSWLGLHQFSVSHMAHFGGCREISSMLTS